MRLLTVSFSRAKDFIFALAQNGKNASLFYSTKRTDLYPGDSVLVELDFPELPNKALIRATVGEVATGDGATLWLSPKDAHTWQFAAELARGNVQAEATTNRRGDRIPLELPVDCRIESETPKWMASKTVDLSKGGAFIRSLEKPEIGTRIRMHLGPTASSKDTFVVYGIVAWTNEDGFGVRFRSQGRDDARRLRTALRRSRETGKFDHLT
jgi:hypothetical protein